jgi:hypothetical protein
MKTDLDSLMQSHDIDALLSALREAGNIHTREDAVLYIGNRVAFGQVKEFRMKRAEAILDRNLLPHIGREKKDNSTVNRPLWDN